MARRKQKPADSPTGWYLVSVVERFQPVLEGRQSSTSRAEVWENYHLIRAGSASQAYDKSIALYRGKRFYTTDRKENEGYWVVEGVSELLPVYEEIEDGCEVMWTDHGRIAKSTARMMTRTKNEVLRSLRSPDTA
jgi:hypothetical protein